MNVINVNFNVATSESNAWIKVNNIIKYFEHYQFWTYGEFHDVTNINLKSNMIHDGSYIAHVRNGLSRASNEDISRYYQEFIVNKGLEGVDFEAEETEEET